MKTIFDVNLHSLFSIDMEEERFMTSLDVIREVMNVPQGTMVTPRLNRGAFV